MDYSCVFENESQLNAKKDWPTNQVLIEAQKSQ